MDNRFWQPKFGFFWSALVLAGGTLLGAVLLLAGVILALAFWESGWLWFSAAGIATAVFAVWATRE